MRYFGYIFVFTLIILLASCSSAKTYLQQGNYPAAIQAGVEKLRKNPKKADKHILAVEQAWKIERTRVMDEIHRLQLEGQPESWIKIHALYEQLDNYQRALKPILPLFIKDEFRHADIEIIDVAQELADTKSKAAEYLYVKGEQLLANNNKYDAREAYGMFQKTKEYYTDFRDVDSRINEAYNAGQNHILIGYSEHTNMLIPQEFMSNLSQYDEVNFNSTWTKFTQDASTRDAFDYVIEVHVLEIAIGPEQVKQNEYTDTKKVQDGTQYVLDEDGNVAKDTLGNDIKEPKYKNIHAHVLRTEQAKAGTLTGVIEFKKANGQVFQTFPFQENLVFQNFYATFTGNKKALSTQSKKIIGGVPQPFPTDMQMVMDASNIVKNNTFGIIKGNIGLVAN